MAYPIVRTVFLTKVYYMYMYSSILILCVFIAPPNYAECVLGQSEMVYVQ